jgi:hypothetical protein
LIGTFTFLATLCFLQLEAFDPMKPWNILLLLSLAGIVAYEIRAHIGHDYQSLTALLRGAAAFTPVVAVVYGIITGHLFWNR